MKLENLIKKGRKGITTLGLAGLMGVGAGGCATTIEELTEGEGMTLLGAIMGASDDSLGIKLAPYVSLLGQMRYQKEIVREGRTQVNINVPENVVSQNEKYFPAPGFTWVNPENPNDLNVRRSIGLAFAANYYKDFNNDGIGDPNEFVGVKDKFYDNFENIILVLYGEQPGIEREIRWEIYNPKGDKLLFAGGSRNNAMGVNWTNFWPNIIEAHGYGSYVIVWRSQGITETKEFEIIPNPNDLTERSIGTTITANYWRDLNNDERADLDEFVGVKDKFYDNERIFLALHGLTGLKFVPYKIYGPTGKKIEGSIPARGMRGARGIADYEEYQKNREGYAATNMISVNDIYEIYHQKYSNHFTSWLRWSAGGGSYVGKDGKIPEKWEERSFIYHDWKDINPEEISGGYGNYEIIWSSRGLTETKEFEIVPSPKKEN